MKMKPYKFNICVFLFAVLSFCSCEQYLDVKPDQSLATPSTVQDLKAIMDNYQMNTLYPIGGDIMSDDYYLEEAVWQSLTDLLYRDTYIWGNETYHDFDWQFCYNLIFRANVTLDALDKISVDEQNREDTRNIRGTALFHRAFTFYHLLQVFTLPYDAGTATTTAGVPLKLSGSLEEPVARASLAQCYAQMEKDLGQAIVLLPGTREFKTQPSKVAAYAQMARVKLMMGLYEQAGLYADSALNSYPDLLDYNAVSATATNPFPMFHTEVILQAFNTGRGGIFQSSRARVDSMLYKSYAPNDLRKAVLFSKNSNGSYAFKGDYSGRNAGNLFAGIATDELYLIKAETECRQDHISSGMDYLNSLLVKRFKTGTFVPYQAAEKVEAVKLVLEERRKELLFRGNMRWGDVRRLAKEPDYAITMKRRIGGEVYELLPNDLRYANLIPLNSVKLSGLSQNKR